MRRFLAALSLAAATFGLPAAACDVGFTVQIPRDFLALQEARDRNRPMDSVPVSVHLTLETQRRTGGWQPAELTVVMAPGWERHGRMGTPRRISYAGQVFNGYTFTPPSLHEFMITRANLQGPGCVADRQFRIRYACAADRSAHQRVHGRAWPERVQTVVLFGGNRVSPRDITHRLTCPTG